MSSVVQNYQQQNPCKSRCVVRTGHSARLRVCMEPDYWQVAAGSSGDAACELVMRLHGWLMRREQPMALLRHEAVCLARALPAALAAVDRLGGAGALADTSLELATPLCHGLMHAAGDPRRRWLPDGSCSQVADVFAALGPGLLRAAHADIRSGAPGSAQRACAAAQLTNAFLQSGGAPSEHAEERPGSQQGANLAAAKRVRLVCLPHLELLMQAGVLLAVGGASVSSSVCSPLQQ